MSTSNSISYSQLQAFSQQKPLHSSKANNTNSIWGQDGFGFGDVLDMINPLQHLPIVGSMYRSITHDTISPASKLVGSGLLGGPIGLVFAAIDVGVESKTGKDTGNHMLGLLGLQDNKDAPTVANAGTAIEVIPTPLASPPLSVDATSTTTPITSIDPHNITQNKDALNSTIQKQLDAYTKLIDKKRTTAGLVS
jgi:hypothetical protein